MHTHTGDKTKIDRSLRNRAQKTRALIVVIVGALLWLAALPAAAQTEQIAYGAFTSNTIDETTPARFYEFAAEEGDYIAVEVIALNSTLDPQVSLLSGGQAALAVSSDDPFQPGSQDARLMYVMPDAGTYTLLVQSEDRTTGQFVLRLDLLDQPETEPLTAGIVTSASVTPDLPERVFSFDSAEGTTITVTSPAPGVGFVVEVHSADGQTVAVQRGPLVTDAQTTVAPSSGVYTVTISTAQANQSATLNIVFGDAADAPTPDEQVAAVDDTDTADTDAGVITGLTPTPDGDETADADTAEEDNDQQVVTGSARAAAANAPSNRCTVVPNGTAGINVRALPDTTAAVIAAIPPGEFRFAQATDGAWIELLGGGWVSAGVVTQSDPCSTLLEQVTSPVVATQAAATAVAQPTAQPDSVNPIGQRN